MTLSTFKRLYQEYHASGLNVKDFCSNQGLAPSTFYYWKKKLQDLGDEKTPGSFVPLVIGSAPATNTSHPPQKRENTTHSNQSIELVFPNGTKMQLGINVDVRLLKTIVHLFD
jgi:transposase-like protein